MTGVLTASPPPPEAAANPSFFDVPQPFTALGGSKQQVTAELVDCEIALDSSGPCSNATGKICLIERGFSAFCTKVDACVRGGGIGTVIFNRADLGFCDPLPLSIVRSGSAQC